MNLNTLRSVFSAAQSSRSFLHIRSGARRGVILAAMFSGALPAAEAATRVSLAWDASASSTEMVLGYKVCWGTVSGTYTESLETGPVTEATVTGLTPGVTYYFVAKTRGANGLESTASNEVTFTASAEAEPVQESSKGDSDTSGQPLTTAAWTASHFTAEELANPALKAVLWGMDANPDGDARSNAWEYAMGSDPLAFDEEPVMTQTLEPGASPDERFAAFILTRNRAAGDALLTLEVSGLTGEFSALEAPVEEWNGVSEGLASVSKYVDHTAVSVASGARRARLKLLLEGEVTPRFSETLVTRALAVAGGTGIVTRATFAGAPLAEPLLAAGVVAGAGSFTLTPATLAPPAGLLEGGACYLVLTSGAKAGTTTDITGIQDGALLLGDDLAKLALPGISFEIRRHHTLRGVFEKDNAGILREGAAAGVADSVHFIRNDGSAEIHFRSSGAMGPGWKNSALQDTGNRVVLPEEGFIINRLAASPVTLFQQGVPAGPGGTRALTVPVERGTNLMTLPFTSGPRTLDQLGLFTGSPRTGIAGMVEYTTSADRLIIMEPGGSSRIYFRSVKDGALGWYSIHYARGKAVLTSSGGVTLEPGAVFYITRNTALPAYAWRMPSAQ